MVPATHRSMANTNCAFQLPLRWPLSSAPTCPLLETDKVGAVKDARLAVMCCDWLLPACDRWACSPLLPTRYDREIHVEDKGDRVSALASQSERASYRPACCSGWPSGPPVPLPVWAHTATAAALAAVAASKRAHHRPSCVSSRQALPLPRLRHRPLFPRK